MQDPEKVSDTGRYQVIDSFGEKVERTDDYAYAVQRADDNSGWIEDEAKSFAVIYDSEDE